MTLDFDVYQDKVLGGWVGKCAGGILGAPIEGIKAFNTIPLTDDLFAVNYPNDDLDLQLLWLDMVKQHGADVRETDFAAHWKNHVGFPWNEYGVATRNLSCGLLPPLSGRHNNYYYHASMGCPIRSEIWGMLCAGNPRLAMTYAKMDASLDHDGFSVEAEQFLSACAALAFVESDIERILTQAVQLLEPNAAMAQLVADIVGWWKTCSYPVAMGKIKSKWGDADFTSAPMNVGFTILALLHNGQHFDCVMDALHLGHDSDCVAATAGALIGIIHGYRSIPEKWKKLVGNEVVISAEITGIDSPKTITDLAAQTCRAAIPFLNQDESMSSTGQWPRPYPVTKKQHHFLPNYDQGTLRFSYENLTDEKHTVVVELKSEHLAFEQTAVELTVAARTKTEGSVRGHHVADAGRAPARTYACEVRVNGGPGAAYHQGTPVYGSYVLIGPFIHDDPARLPMRPDYPEHGLSSMPSVDYMNHDGLNMQEEFIDLAHPEIYLDESTWPQYPFQVQKISPDDFRIDFSRYYYGKGERVVYLYSTIECPEDTKKWVSIGSTAPFQLRINQELLYEKAHTSRSWIGDNVVLADLKKGRNTLLIKVGLITDANLFELGFREFTGKHPHQEQWALLVPAL
ncbi:ADP-ribosylglycohydrolase family protein [Hymenobacter sp.]|uniref:ADP-ribosylglycohydrolase family protein n=1 Tax=Hymenobacter sp. TaxID=1898978 RepID=UPI00286D088B|nr:ADP-ribosylglycohydrolase family protein [Hymenobacter sp.]